MQVEQISYGSVKRRQMKGYQIIGKSPAVDGSLSSSFCQWAPSHNSLEVVDDQQPEDAWGLSFFPLQDSHHAVARSVHGGPEYSGRGGLAVVTSALILNQKQLARYQYHALDLARTTLVLGNLLLPKDKSSNLLPVTIPGQALPLPFPNSDFTDSTPPVLPNHVVRWIARESVSLLRDQRKVLIIGKCDPLPILALVLDQLSSQERGEISFACGIKPSSRRDFRLQFTYEAMSPKLKKDAERSGIAPIDIANVLAKTQ